MTLRAISKPGQYESDIQRVHHAITVLIRSVTRGIAGTDWTSETGENKPDIQRIDDIIAVGVSIARAEQVQMGTYQAPVAVVDRAVYSIVAVFIRLAEHLAPDPE